jgi:hypothetical protein
VRSGQEMLTVHVSHKIARIGFRSMAGRETKEERGQGQGTDQPRSEKTS